MANIPAGPTIRLTTNATTSTTVNVASDVPVNAYELFNNGSNPIQVKFFVNGTGYVSWPTTSTAAYDLTLNHGAVSPQTYYLPARLASSLSGLGGFTTTVTVSAISEAGTPAVYITPVQVPNKGN
jgi:hypothetical protein